MTKVMINKNVFGIKDLNARELRLYLLICSRQYLTMDLTKEDKKFVLGSSRNNAKDIPTYFDNLVEYDLITYDIDTDGYVSVLSRDKFGKASNFIAFDEVPNVKSLRQLFILSLNKWYVRYNKTTGQVQFINNPIISKEVFETLFGTDLKEINRYWKRTCEQCNVNYTWSKSQNTTILVKVVEKNEFESNSKETVEDKKEERKVEQQTTPKQEENVSYTGMSKEAISKAYEEEGVPQEEAKTEVLYSFVNGTDDDCDTTWSLVNGGVK